MLFSDWSIRKERTLTSNLPDIVFHLNSTDHSETQKAKAYVKKAKSPKQKQRLTYPSQEEK